MAVVLSSPIKSCISRKNAKSVRTSVCFERVEIREYPREVGDNPSVQSGPPLTLGWNHIRETQVHVDEFEESRPPPRSYDDLQLSHYQRQLRLLDHGISKEEQRIAEQMAAKARRDRIETSLHGPTREKIDEVMESARRKFMRLIRGRPRTIQPTIVVCGTECETEKTLKKSPCSDDSLEETVRTVPLTDMSDEDSFTD